MWEPGAATAIMRRTRTKLSRFTFHHVPNSPTWDGDPAPDPPAATPPALYPWTDDVSLVAAFRQLLGDFDQLYLVEKSTLSHPRIRDMRRWVDDAIPGLYRIAAENNPLAFKAKGVLAIAEVFLARFPDVRLDHIRAKYTPKPPPAHASSPSLRPDTPLSGPFTPPHLSADSLSIPSALDPPAPNSDLNDHRHAHVHPQLPVSQEVLAMFSAVHDMLGTTVDSVLDAPPAQSPLELHHRIPHTPESQIHSRDIQHRHALTPETPVYTMRQQDNVPMPSPMPGRITRPQNVR